MKTKLAILLVTLFSAHFSVAGGVHCKRCPAESDSCIPRSDCRLSPDHETDFDALAGFDFRCTENSVDTCKAEPLGTACTTSSGEIGHCGLTPATAGSFCLCYSSHRNPAPLLEDTETTRHD